MTKTQEAILKIVYNQQHSTADSVYEEVKKEIPGVALGTVYRNLSQFTENGVIRRVFRSNAPDFFDGNTAPHDHIICINCGEISDIHLPELFEAVNAHTKTRIVSVELSVSHICNSCAANKAATPY